MLGAQTGTSHAAQTAPLPWQVDNAVQLPAVHDPLAALDLLKTAGARVAFKRGEEIVAEGNAADYCYKVVSGSVRLVKLVADGRRQVCEFLVAGDFIGITADADHYFTAEATADSVLMRFPRRQVESLIATNPALAQYVHKLTSAGLQTIEAEAAKVLRRDATLAAALRGADDACARLLRAEEGELEAAAAAAQQLLGGPLRWAGGRVGWGGCWGWAGRGAATDANAGPDPLDVQRPAQAAAVCSRAGGLLLVLR